MHFMSASQLFDGMMQAIFLDDPLNYYHDDEAAALLPAPIITPMMMTEAPYFITRVQRDIIVRHVVYR